MKRLYLGVLLMACSCNSQPIPPAVKPGVHTVTVTKTTVTNPGFGNLLPLIVAGVALATSALSLYSSSKLKDKEFRNDYYKKVLDNRLKALEHAESLIYLFRNVKSRKEDGKKHYALISDLERQDKFNDVLENILRYSIWYDEFLDNEIKDFCGSIAVIINDSIEVKDRFELAKIGEEKHIILQEYLQKISLLISESLFYLDDTKAFLKRKKDNANKKTAN